MNRRVSELLELTSKSPAMELREQIFEQINSLLEVADDIRDSSARLSIQAHCLDVITALEGVIEKFELEDWV